MDQLNALNVHTKRSPFVNETATKKIASLPTSFDFFAVAVQSKFMHSSLGPLPTKFLFYSYLIQFLLS